MVSPCPLLLYQGGVWRLQSAVRTEMLGDAWSGGLLSMVLSPTGKWKLAIPYVNLSSAVNTHQLNPHERDFDFFSRNFEILWRLRSSSQNTRGRTNTAATWQVPLPGSAWRDAARPENDVWSSYSGGGYVGMFLSVLYFRDQAKKKYLVHYYLLPC